MTHPYDASGRYGPVPAPAVEITLEWRGRRSVVKALIDTGASISALPKSEFAKLRLKKIGDPEEIGGVAKTKADNTVVNLTFEGATFSNWPVLAIDDLPCTVVGRDILNRYVLECNGPALTFQLNTP